MKMAEPAAAEAIQVTSDVTQSLVVAGGFSDSFQAFQEFWLGNFILNILGYAVLILPGYLLVRWLQRLPQVERGSRGMGGRAQLTANLMFMRQLVGQLFV